MKHLIEKLREIALDQEMFKPKLEFATWEGLHASTDKLDALKLILDAFEDPDVEYWFKHIS